MVLPIASSDWAPPCPISSAGATGPIVSGPAWPAHPNHDHPEQTRITGQDLALLYYVLPHNAGPLAYFDPDTLPDLASAAAPRQLSVMDPHLLPPARVITPFSFGLTQRPWSVAMPHDATTGITHTATPFSASLLRILFVFSLGMPEIFLFSSSMGISSFSQSLVLASCT